LGPTKLQDQFGIGGSHSSSSMYLFYLKKPLGKISVLTINLLIPTLTTFEASFSECTNIPGAFLIQSSIFLNENI
jgi:hypothetical protein